MVGDTLIGYVNGSVHEMTLSETKQVRAKYPEKGRTVLFVAGVTAAAVGIALAVNGSGIFCTVRRGGDGQIQPC
jgi:hypothetical protein